MSAEHTVIEESDLAGDGLAPSETFARLIKRVGNRAAVGALGLSAIQDLVVKRAGTAGVAEPEVVSVSAQPEVSDT